MNPHRILVVESDALVAAQIKNALESIADVTAGNYPYQGASNGQGIIQVAILADGNQALQEAKDQSPDLIVLCIELPKISGYSICNKLKKNPDLRGIPLIIMSSEATPDIFEQHKKLKTRAEDYLIKPFPIDDLVGKVCRLLGLAPAPAPSFGAAREGIGTRTTAEVTQNMGAREGEVPFVYDDEPLNGEEIEIEDTYLLDGIGNISPGSEDEDPTRVVVDNEISLATELAFAALEIPTDQRSASTGKMEVLSPSEAAHEKSLATEGEPITAPPVEALDVEEALPDAKAIEVEVASSTRVTPHPSHESTDPGGRLELESSSLLRARPGPGEESPLAMSRATSGLEESLRYRLQELEQENRSLNDELQSVLSQPSDRSANFSRDRELLNLREVINKKEKEILDLKDDLDSKERQILDHKDKVRELERKVRDMDEKLLGVEREIVSANERIQFFQTDKEKLLEREKSIKARLDEAKLEIDKAYSEVDSLKMKQKEMAERMEAEKVAAVHTLEQEIAGLHDQYHGTLERLQAQRANEMELLRQEHENQLQQLQMEHERGLTEALEGQQLLQQQAEAAHCNEVAAINLRYEKEVQDLRNSQNEELKRLRAENERTLEQVRGVSDEQIGKLREDHEADRQWLKQENQKALDQLKAEHGQEIKWLGEQQRQEMTDREAFFAGEKEALRTEHRAEMDHLKQDQENALKELEQQYKGRMDELQQRYKDRVAGMEGRHRSVVEEIEGERRQEREDLHARIASQEGRIEALQQSRDSVQQDLEETRQQVSQLESDLRLTREMVANRDQRIQENEQQVAACQDQILRAFNKIRTDEQLAEKAKRAMAVAITLLEEQKKATLEGEPAQ